MKKFVSFLLCAVLMSAFFSIFAVPAMADDSITVSDYYGFVDALSKVKEGGTINVINDYRLTYLYVRENIDIDTPCTINFKNVYFTQNDCRDSFLEVNANDVTLNFNNCEFRTKDGRATICNERGSAIHVDGKNCIINGNGSTLFWDCCTNALYGGAIYIDDGYSGCRIDGCEFRSCCAAMAGGAIYSSADDCVISNCVFDDCMVGDRTFFVYGEENSQTRLVNCTDGDGNPCYEYNCPGCVFVNTSGFTLSDGNWWIIAAGGVVILGGLAAIVIVNKKKKSAV